MLEKFPEQMRDMLRAERIKQERALVKERLQAGREFVNHMGKWVAAIMGIVFLLIWALHI